MAVDASLLTNNLGEVKYNQLPDISAISSQFAAADQARSQTARNNILAQDDQRVLTNNQRADNYLAQNPGVQGEERNRGLQQFGTQGAKVGEALNTNDQASFNLTEDKIKAATDGLRSAVDDNSYQQYLNYAREKFGPDALKNLPPVYNKAQVDQLIFGGDKLLKTILEMKKLEQGDKRIEYDYEINNRRATDSEKRTDLMGGASARSGDNKIISDQIVELNGFGANLPKNIQDTQMIENALVNLDKSPNQGGPITGGLGETRTSLLRGLSSFVNLSPEAMKSLESTENLSQTFKRIVSQEAMTTPVKGKAGLTDADLQFVKELVGGTIELTPETLKKAFRIGLNNKLASENDAIKKSRDILKNTGRRSVYLEQLATRPLKSMISHDGVTLVSPDGKAKTLPSPEAARAARDKYNAFLAEEAANASY
jgi:hypothetical protein